MTLAAVLLVVVRTVLGADSNPDENLGVNDKNLFEGDIKLAPGQKWMAEDELDVDSSRRKRGSSRRRLWPGGIIVYAIQSKLARNSRASAAIKAGMDEWTNKTCIRFKARTNERSYVYFRSGAGCSSYLGRIGKAQPITLTRRCWTRGVVAHEIGHALGFYHEQSRPDRDNYITVVIANIPRNLRHNFRKYSRSTIDSLGTPYDYGSVMHYGSKAFSRNGRPTIRVKKTGVTIGQRKGLSPTDALQANLLYSGLCAVVPTSPPSAPTSQLQG